MQPTHPTLSRVLFLLAFAAAYFTAQPAAAQETPQIAEIDIDGGKDEPPAKSISLRPNTPINLGFDLRNKTPDTLRDVVVRVIYVAGAEERLVAEAKVKEIPPTPASGKGERVLLFDKIKGADKPPPPPPPEKGAKAPSDKHELTGPPFQVLVQIEARQPKDFPITKRKFELVARQPREYVASSATFDQLTKRLSVRVNYPKEEDLFGPHRYPLGLKFSPNVKVDKKGLFNDAINGPKDVGVLRADFEQLAGEGEAYVTIDGYERAYTYPIKLAASGAINALPREDIRVRIQVPRYAKPGAQFEVLLEADGPLSDDYQIRIALDKTGEKIRFRDEFVKTGLRHQKASLSVSTEKKLFCEVDVTDWRLAFDTTNVFSDIWFRVNVWKKVGKDFEKVKVSFPEGSRAHLAPIEADDDNRNLYVRVSLDESPPADLQYVNLPKTWPATRPLEVKVKMRERQATQAPIGKVIFFKGRLPKDEKAEIKEDDILVAIDTPDPKKSEFSFVLPPQNKTEPIIVTTLFVTRTGVKASITESIDISANAPGSGLYTIKGKVMWGELPQPDLPVSLAGEEGKGKVKILPSKTDSKGNFVFKDVPPGAYVVTSQMTTRNYAGRIDVVIRDTDLNNAVIDLLPVVKKKIK
jgi:hypothetical protein